MAISIVDINQNYQGVNGAYVGQQQPLFLGKKGLCLKLDADFGTSAIIGFDTRVSPVAVRVFFEKGSDIITGTAPRKNYGLVLTTEYFFDGQPIMPSRVNPSLAYLDNYNAFREPYLGSSIFGFPKPPTNTDSIVMVRPKTLKDKQIGDPYYAYNAYAYEATQNAWDVTNGTGFMASLNNELPFTANGSPRCTSVYMPIGLDIDTPTVEWLEQRVESFENDSIEAVSFTDAGNGDWLGGILTALESDGSNVLRVQRISYYVLLTMDDPENYYPMVLADLQNEKLYLLDTNELEQLRFEASSYTFEKFIEHTNGYGLQNQDFPSRAGYYTRSYKVSQDRKMNTMLSGGTHTLSCRYKAYAVGNGVVLGNGLVEDRNVYDCFGGVTWNVERVFNKETFSFGALKIYQPELLSLQDIINYNVELYQQDPWNRNPKKGQDLPALNRFIQTLRSFDFNPKDTSSNELEYFLAPDPLPTNKYATLENKL